MSATAPDTGTPAPPPAGSTRHLVWLFAPAGMRGGLAALFAVESEIAASLRPGLDHGVAHARLEWWTAECASLAAGRPSHPLTRALLAAALARNASPPDLAGLVEAARFDLAAVACETRTELDELFDHWALAAFRTVVAFGAGGLQNLGAAERFAREAGPALREIENLSRLATDAWSGRIRVPLSDEPGAPARWRTQPWPDDCATVVAARLADARARLAAAAAALEPSLRAAQRAALVWCALAARLGARAAASLPMQFAPSRIDALADTLCAWRAALAAERGRLPTALRIVQ